MQRDSSNNNTDNLAEMSTRDTTNAVDELAEQLAAALNLDGQTASAEDAAINTGDNAEPGAKAEAAVPGYCSEGESADDAASTASSASSSSSSEYGVDSDSSVVDGPPPPLSVYEPLLPKGVKTVFADGMSSVDSIVDMVKTGASKRIIIMTGAGTSTDAGIPDFRSPRTGLYANLKKFNLPYPEAIFSMDFFRKNPKPFYVLAKELYPGQYTPTLSHFFVKLLAQKGLLLRHYTQNIDCLERVAGIDHELIVEAHGSFHTAHCIGRKCRKEHSSDWVKGQIHADKTPRCTECSALVKPDITFFGESLPSRFFELTAEDFGECDLLIVMGTSLQVRPFASLVDEVKPSVPRLLVNRMRVGESRIPGMGLDFDGRYSGPLHRDALLLGDCDEACALLADRLGWKSELMGLREEFISNQHLGRN